MIAQLDSSQDLSRLNWLGTKDEAMFESYWIDQFATLLNVTGNRAGKTDSQTARQIIAAIKAQLDQAKQPLP